MSLLSHQSAINPNSNFWIKNGQSTFTFGNITANTISSGVINANTVDANQISLDNAILTVQNGDELLLNGIPIATTDQFSSIQDWSLYPAISSILTANPNADIGTSNAPYRAGYFSTIYAKDAVIQSTTLTLTETVSSLFVNDLFGSTITAQYGNFSNLSTTNLQATNTATSNITGGAATFSSLIVQNAQIGNISTIVVPGGTFSNITAQNGVFSTITARNGSISTLNSSTLNVRQGNFTQTNTTTGFFTNAQVNQNFTVGSNLTVNQTLSVPRVEAVSTIRGNRAEFSSIQIRRVEDVSTITGNLAVFSTIRAPVANISTLFVSTLFVNNPQSNFNNINASNITAFNITASNQLYGNDTRGQQGTFSNQVNIGYYSNILGSGYNMNVNSAGDITTDGNVDCGDIDCLDITACNVTVGGAAGLADVEIYGSTALPGDSALYVEGGVEFQGGFIHGFSAGALPVAGINTQRFSLTPAGITVISPTFISLNSAAVMNQAAGGAYSLAVGGVANLAAGTYFEIDSGYMKFINNCPIILSANSGAGDPGGLNLNTYIQSNSLQMDGLPFGALEKYQSSNSWTVSSTSANIFLENLSLPRIGQWYIKTSFEIVKQGGGSANATDAVLYYAPVANPPLSAFNQSIFGAPLYSMPSSQVLTINAPVIISTITGFTSTIQSTITESFSTFLSTGQTFSTFTSSFFSTLTANGGLNLYFDGSQSQNNFTATVTRGSLYASYLGGYIPPA